MSIGRIARTLLGKHFYRVGMIYRSFFVDLKFVTESIEPFIPQGAAVVDVGGGDGTPLNYLLALRSDIRVTLIDTGSSLGGAIKTDYLNRVELHPETTMAEFSKSMKAPPDVVLLSDVIHHIPAEARKPFFSELRMMIADKKRARIIIKDLQPGHIRSTLGFMADRYISGDKAVTPAARDAVTTMMKETFGSTLSCQETDLFRMDCPNYALVFTNE